MKHCKVICCKRGIFMLREIINEYLKRVKEKNKMIKEYEEELFENEELDQIIEKDVTVLFDSDDDVVEEISNNLEINDIEG